MNVFLKEMKSYRKSLIFWIIGVIFLVASSMSKFAGLSSAGQSMNDLMADMPKSLQVIMGTGAFDISTAIGYFGILYIYLILMATIHAVMLGASVIAKEECDKTAEFLFVKPYSRNKIISAKLMTGLTNIVIFNLISWVTSYFLVSQYSENEAISSDLAVTMVGMFILCSFYSYSSVQL